MTFPLMVRAIRLTLEGIDAGLEEAARTLGAGPLDRFFSITLPLMLPGILAGAVTAFAAGLGEFGAVITFVSNIPGRTRTLPLALYTALQTPTGDVAAARLAVISFTLGLAGLVLSEWLARALARAGAEPADARRSDRASARGDFRCEVAFQPPTPGIIALFGRSGCGKTTLVAACSPDCSRPDRGRDPHR